MWNFARSWGGILLPVAPSVGRQGQGTVAAVGEVTLVVEGLRLAVLGQLDEVEDHDLARAVAADRDACRGTAARREAVVVLDEADAVAGRGAGEPVELRTVEDDGVGVHGPSVSFRGGTLHRSGHFALKPWRAPRQTWKGI